MSDFRAKLGRELLINDGGMGSLLQARGLKGGELPERWNITHPDDIIAVHTAYLEAGADMITTNTFGANALKYHDPDDTHKEPWFTEYDDDEMLDYLRFQYMAYKNVLDAIEKMAK